MQLAHPAPSDGQLALFGLPGGPLEAATILELDVLVRWWEDGKLNGTDDESGGMPFRSGDRWQPFIELATGLVLDWPEGVFAHIHYKVCDEGEYWLLNAQNERIAKWKDYYVPDRILCIGDRGFGDYVIFPINEDGRIPGWKAPKLDSAEWTLL
jgi:hypothetical protein